MNSARSSTKAGLPLRGVDAFGRPGDVLDRPRFAAEHDQP